MANALTQIRNDWSKNQQAKTRAIPGKPWGWQWGAEGIFNQVRKLKAFDHIFNPVLDVGCGGGKWDKWLFKSPKVKTVYAIDVHQTAITETKKYEPRAIVSLCNGTTFEFADQSVGTVFILDVLLHLPQTLVQQYFNEAYRVAQKTLVINIPDMATPIGKMMYLSAVQSHVWDRVFSYGYMSYYHREQIECMMRHAGWKPLFLGHTGARGPRDMVYVGLKE